MNIHRYVHYVHEYILSKIRKRNSRFSHVERFYVSTDLYNEMKPILSFRIKKNLTGLSLGFEAYRLMIKKFPYTANKINYTKHRYLASQCRCTRWVSYVDIQY